MLLIEEKQLLKKLALEVKRISEAENTSEKIALWEEHNTLAGKKPMIFVHPDGSWNELLPYSSMECRNPVAQSVEYQLRKKIFRHNYIKDDVPIEAKVIVHKQIYNSMWGVEPKFARPESSTGVWHHVPIIEKSEDWKMLKAPVISHDEKATSLNYDIINDAIGDIVEVELVGFNGFNFHMMHWYCDYRGLDNMLMDLYDEPETVHEVMRFFTDNLIKMYKQLESENLLSLNNDETFHYTGGVGYNKKELPAKGFDGRVRLCDVWGAAEAQEFSNVSPAMHEEFILSYEREVLELFGLNGYGCCDDLSRKLDNVLKIKNLRRVAVCPWADIGNFTPVLKKNYIMTWKPNPSYLAFEKMDTESIEAELKSQITKANGGILELILRDTHTVLKQPERFEQWVALARKAIDLYWVG